MITLMLAAITTGAVAVAQPAGAASVAHQLDDVMELTDTAVVKARLAETAQACARNPTVLNQTRLGIVWHETALNLGLLSDAGYKGYAQKSYDQLTALSASAQTPADLMPFIASYRASALSLVVAETKKLKLLGTAFGLFDDAVQRYAGSNPLPWFLRGSVAENLPWFFFRKRRIAKGDFEAIIERQEADPGYAGARIMSFTYWAWANQHRGRRYRPQALAYLDRAIRLDPDGNAGRPRAEALKKEMTE